MQTAYPAMSAPLQGDDLEALYPQFFSEIVKLTMASDAEFASRFPRFVSELERDFAMEEQWMEDARFIELRHHREQHAELLRLLHHVHERMMAGDLSLGRKIMPLLSHWFAVHIANMDLAWASALHQQSLTPAMRHAA